MMIQTIPTRKSKAAPWTPSGLDATTTTTQQQSVAARRSRRICVVPKGNNDTLQAVFLALASELQALCCFDIGNCVFLDASPGLQNLS
eukprot:jgi/Psemu1/2200/gm1.2200_g